MTEAGGIGCSVSGKAWAFPGARALPRRARAPATSNNGVSYDTTEYELLVKAEKAAQHQADKQLDWEADMEADRRRLDSEERQLRDMLACHAVTPPQQAPLIYGPGLVVVTVAG